MASKQVDDLLAPVTPRPHATNVQAGEHAALPAFIRCAVRADTDQKAEVREMSKEYNPSYDLVRTAEIADLLTDYLGGSPEGWYWIAREMKNKKDAIDSIPYLLNTMHEYNLSPPRTKEEADLFIAWR